MKSKFLKISLATIFVVLGSFDVWANVELDGQGQDLSTQSSHIKVFTLDNGLKVIVCPKKDAATVSVQLWYNVGSKDEVEGERGIAHFIEHMIFKGTETLTESDIDLVSLKLSGNCNAFTWYDYTGYLYNIPVANWDKVLPMMADCMENCRFQQDHLNSELKAVIQEMKMCKDQLARNLKEVVISNIFESHPYHYSTIGFKQDLWTVNRDTLLAFYKKFYTPDNAALIVVGDVDPVNVYEKATQAFGNIPAGNGWNQRSFYINEDIKSKTINIYRDVQQAICTVAFVVPGLVEQKEFELDVFAYALANGRGSRLYKLLMDELQLVVDVYAFSYDMFDKEIFFVEFLPKDEKDIARIVDCIQSQIDDIARGNLSLQEIQRARRFSEISYQQMLENSQEQANVIGKYFVALQDPYASCNFGKISTEELMNNIQEIAATFCISSLRHQGNILAIPGNQVQALNKLQEVSDQEDKLFLDAKKRESAVEGGSYVYTVSVNDKAMFNYSKPTSVILDNGLELSWFHSDAVDTVACQLLMKANHTYDDDALQGIGAIVSEMLLEGTKNYPGQDFVEQAESYGISFSVAPGSIGTIMLKQDLEKGLDLLAEMLINASFEQASFEKVKEQRLSELKNFWDTPTKFHEKLVRDLVYKNHPCANVVLGSQKGVAEVTLENCIEYYKKMISPQQAHLVLVGNLAECDIQSLVEKILGVWQGDFVEDLQYPVLTALEKQEVLSPINRDQVVLAFAGLSVDRFHEDYDKILLYDQIFCGSVMFSMSTRLFKLRQQSGLFYTSGGSLLSGAGEQPGMIFVRTIVSQDRVDEAVKAFLQVFDEGVDNLTEDELSDAKRVLINSFDKLFETNTSKASTFLFLKKYNLPLDYFEKRIESLQKITVEDVKIAVKKILSSDKLAVVKIGRV
ncbi:insulinase family protein [Candidatus Babeliales bacterium]|nr:insulinase family protein [Candidatus Babeliales bacterium]MBP9843472.1 insulinase family protein [Candidatus Babeliales bacterium]